jgi:hypothetical protein
MTVKFTYNEDKETFGFKGLEGEHLIAILKLLEHVRLGKGVLAHAALEIITAYEYSEHGGDLDYLTSDAVLDVAYDLQDGGSFAPVILDPDGNTTSPTIILAMVGENV